MILALFGAPLAHEDHPQRALYAALRMQDAMRRYGDTLRQQGYPPLLMRVGLNTGVVVLRSIRNDDLHADYVPVGHSTNLAARMEQLAAPGSIVASAYTQKLTDGYFTFKDLGATQIKGVEEPLHIYERPMPVMMARAGDAATPTPISPSEIEISAGVVLTVEIK